jgi:hypothetical protein
MYGTTRRLAILIAVALLTATAATDSRAQHPDVTGGLSWGYHTDTEHAALVWTPDRLFKVPDHHAVFLPYAVEVTEGIGGPSIGGVRGVAWEPWTDWTPVPSALVWTDNRVLRNSNDSYSAGEVTTSPGGASIADIRGITWEDWYGGYIGDPVALIWNNTQLYSYYSSGPGAEQVTVDPGGSPVGDIQGITWEHWEENGGRPVALIWTRNKVFYYNSNISLNTVTEVKAFPGPPFLSISDVRGIVWEHCLPEYGRPSALIWTPTKVFYYNFILDQEYAAEVKEDDIASIDDVQGIVWQENESGGHPWALIWTPDHVFHYNTAISFTSATEVNKPMGPPFRPIEGVLGIASQHWQGTEVLTEALIWNAAEVWKYTAGNTIATEIKEDGITSIDGVQGVAWETVAYPAGAPSALVWTSDKVLSYSPLAGTATEVQIDGPIEDVRGITWEYWVGENTPIALIWTPDRVFQHNVTGLADDEVEIYVVGGSIVNVQGIVWEPFEEPWDEFTPAHTALILTPTNLFWYLYSTPQAYEVQEGGNPVYSYDSTLVDMVQVAVQQAGHHDFGSPIDGLRTSQSGAGMVGIPACTAVGYTGSASGAAVVPTSGIPPTHITVLGGSPYPNTAMILGPAQFPGFVSGDAMCLFGYGDLSGAKTEDKGSLQLRPTLEQSRPNPFHPTTTICYTLPAADRVDLKIFDVAGRLVRDLQNDVLASEGRHRVAWDGKDTSGRMVSPGVYFYRLTVGGYTETKRAVLLR